MKSFKITALVIIIISIITACGSSDGKLSSQGNDSISATKQQKLEEENEKLRNQLAEKTAVEKKEKEAKKAEEQAKLQEASKKTRTAEMMKMLVPYLDEDKVLNEKTYNYIVDHYELFPALTTDSKIAAKAEVDDNITARHLFKNITPYLDKMVMISGYVLRIKEAETAMGTVADIQVIDENTNSIYGIYMNSTGDILDGDFVTMIGVPTGLSSMKNLGGGTTSFVILTVSTITK
ncbi:hypothetical protein [Paenibacillus segetis]|uniref:Uncharacterized protein n=1 Tax=Paenibacillus segetis TaxID=1325360 RepID=A0ABQ1YA21_9BACL|nr:hypothetical protein [Paenibacillus segetis]GGH16982.1 hypothetical protein GCM10008013_12120 [Paenibacillus segetis]